MVSAVRAVIVAFQQLSDEYHLDDSKVVIGLARQIVQQYMIPFSISLMMLVMTYRTVDTVYRWVVPLPSRIRYEEALDMYPKHPRQSLQEFKRLVDRDKYGPALLSLAAHEIYVVGDPIKGRRLLRQGHKGAMVMTMMNGEEKAVVGDNKTRIGKVRCWTTKVPARDLKTMEMDSKAIEETRGNRIMIDMNARIMKQDYLGLVTVS